MARGADQMLATVAHASPFAYFQLSRGDVRLRLPATGERLASGTDARVLGLKVMGKTYAVFGPTGVRWEQVSATEWIGRLPAGAGYFSAAALPDDKAETVALFSRHAYAFVQDTRVDWRYEHDVLKRETRVHSRYGGDYEGRNGIKVRDLYEGSLGISTVDLSQAWAKGTARFELTFPEVGTCTAEATLNIRSDREAFYVDIALRAERQNELVAERQWTERFAR